ncbi:glycosyltransferase family 2 protein [Hyphomonas sp.]|uniref:glycosyltransferase family 2 protein n=1 Tax=Hyphomonas sp. TaxID=87 RepID=UPI003565D625
MSPVSKLSVVLVTYNMAREIPRTLESLSAPVQHALSVADYEIIVVDNGSTKPFDRARCEAIAPNIRFLDQAHPTASPAGAMNSGIRASSGEFVCAMVDGARMASPGLLRRGIEALQMGPDVIAGTIAHHLGPKVQSESMKEGYNQSVEDALLETVDWRRDGYKLFGISALAGSSAHGWYKLPVECNAIFMRRATWDQLGGYDERFQTPGGGLCNLDLWKRAVDYPSSRIVMLLGESTFHQFHGGIATNAQVSPWNTYAAEYLKIRGKPFAPSQKDFVCYGPPPQGA